jgi:acyl-CoA thioester hydrolase
LTRAEQTLWDHPDPFVLEVTAGKEDLDSYEHVNNVVYIRWLERCAWAHSAAVGFPESRCVALARGMAVRTIHVHYLAACYAGDRILVGNWICRSDGRLRVSRRYQLINPDKATTVMRGEVDFVCMNLSNGRPVRMPAEMAEAYAVTV